jgi:hypothetical protein
MDALIEEQIEGEGGNGTVPPRLSREAHRSGDAVAGLTADEERPVLVERFYVSLNAFPLRVRVELEGALAWCATLHKYVQGKQLFETEKEAIDKARSLRMAEIKRLETEVDELDRRYDALEDVEMANETAT